MTICIAGLCKHGKGYAFVLCSDFQGTRGDYIKADDTHKVWHFHGRRGAIMFAGDADAGAEFFRRFQAVALEFEKIEKPDDEGHFDVRVGEYLAKVRELTVTFKKERADHAISRIYGATLNEFHSRDAPTRFSSKLYDDIADTIKKTDLGAEFLIAYAADEEPLLIRIEQSGYVALENSHYVAIGSGEPLAMAVFCQIDQDTSQTLPECLTWVYQAKKFAENNPYVGELTALWVISQDGDDYTVTDEAWQVLEQTPGVTLATISSGWDAVKEILKSTP